MDPAHILRQLREFEPNIATSDLPPQVKHLRTNPLKQVKELRESAIFCHGMSCRLGEPVLVAQTEAQDYDFVASWLDGTTQHLAPVQLKEVVPAVLNPQTNLDAVIRGLEKYVDSDELTVAIHLNRLGHFDPKRVIVPPLRIAALWVFAAIKPDQSEWGLWGNFLEEPQGTRFAYPT